MFTFLGPVILDPIFNTFTPLPEGSTRDDVLALARRAGVDVGEVYEVDASRRTTAANAYVNGIGRTKRVVLYDTLLTEFTPAETRLVIAHELGHVHFRDVPQGSAVARARRAVRDARGGAGGRAAAAPRHHAGAGREPRPGAVHAGRVGESPTSSHARSSAARTTSRCG